MSVLAWLSNEAHIIEADVQKVVAAIIKAEHVTIADLEKSLSYIAANAPTVVNELAAVSSFLELLGPAVPQAAAVGATLDVAKGIVQNLQAFSDQYQKATQGGGISAHDARDTVLAGYNVLVSAKASLNDIKAKATAPQAAK
jgi:hypothetical protein